MFDDILGPREEEKKPYLGEKRAIPASVGGISSPEGMDPTKKSAKPSIGGLKGRPIPVPIASNAPKQPHDIDEEEEPELELDFDYDDPDEDCGCDDCGCDDCGGDCDTGCLKDKDVWSTMKLG